MGKPESAHLIFKAKRSPDNFWLVWLMFLVEDTLRQISNLVSQVINMFFIFFVDIYIFIRLSTIYISLFFGSLHYVWQWRGFQRYIRLWFVTYTRLLSFRVKIHRLLRLFGRWELMVVTFLTWSSEAYIDTPCWMLAGLPLLADINTQECPKLSAKTDCILAYINSGLAPWI